MNVPEAEQHLRATCEKLMPGWPVWARAQGLSRLERHICMGPETSTVYLADRALINGLGFACMHVQKEGGGRACVVMVEEKMEDGEPLLRVGQLQHMFEWSPPWDLAGELEGDERLTVANVQWHKHHGVNSELLDCPQVSREFFDDPVGNLIRMQEIVPVHAALVPHLQERTWWQVLYRELPS